MRPLKVLGICASPRKGNSEFLLDKALSAAAKVDKSVEITSYTLRGKKMGPCVACGFCGKKAGACAVKDDFQELNELWHASDVIIYSAAVYHMSMPGQLKCFIDRLGNAGFGRFSGYFEPGKESLPKTMKVIGSIAQGVHTCSGQEHTITDLINHALIMQCVPVTGDMWESYIGGGSWTRNDIATDAFEKQYNQNELDAIVAVRSSESIAKRAVEMALIIRAGAATMRDVLEKDPTYKPFYNLADS